MDEHRKLSHPTDTLSRDLHLELMQAMVGQNEGNSLTITVLHGGSLVSGQLVHTGAWQNAWLQQLETGGLQGMDEWRKAVKRWDELGADDPDLPPNFISLRDVVIVSGGGVSGRLDNWRCRLDAVDGWSVGHPNL